MVPGDSGGPLADSEGEVVGIDVAASSGTTSATIDGYAIPIEDAMAVVEQILTGTESSTVQVGANAYLGVQVTDASSAYPEASYRGYPTGTAATGAVVAAVVEGSPAADAGLAAGDTITAVGSTAISSAAELGEALGGYGVGDKMGLSWTDATGTTSSATPRGEPDGLSLTSGRAPGAGSRGRTARSPRPRSRPAALPAIPPRRCCGPVRSSGHQG